MQWVWDWIVLAVVLTIGITAALWLWQAALSCAAFADGFITRTLRRGALSAGLWAWCPRLTRRDALVFCVGAAMATLALSARAVVPVSAAARASSSYNETMQALLLTRLEGAAPETRNHGRPLCGGVRAIRIGRLWGFADASGDIVVEPQYLEVKDCVEGHAAVLQAGRWFFIEPSRAARAAGDKAAP